MKITYVETECRDKISPQCTKSFMRERKPGRPQVNCDACKAQTKPVVVSAAKPASRDRECPCGTKFVVPGGRGRKASKCDACRAAGTVYRVDDDGITEAVLKDQLDREQQERRDAEGKLRAENLFNLMSPLLLKTNRTVIPH